ncbi:uncharacterized protein LOC124818209 [Hydra vulgaris]|uniref:uncharacterized protein LOC124818209 n=1 Tax=Hydra vulgaris TaxID=6087 RepID=UPI0032E9C3E8
MFFDMLNVNNKFQGQKNRKPALYPYHAVDDWRFEWLQNTYLKYINEWKAKAESNEGTPKEMKTKLCLSSQTIQVIRITVHSFVELVPYLLSRVNDGQELYFLSDKLNQDSVEEHFGRIRSRGGANENPTAYEYGLLNRKVIVVKSDLLKVIRGNTRGCIREELVFDVNDNRELHKRSKRK